MDDTSHEPPRPPVEAAPDRMVASEESTHEPAAVQTLREAMRRARFDDAERAGVLADLRATRVARLELLQDALKPLAAQIPADTDFFDIALAPGAVPRLFIDMIGFVEMGRDARVYRFVQDTRHGRVKIAESADVNTIVEAVTGYVAHRLLERDKALAALDAARHEDHAERSVATMSPATAPAPPAPASTAVQPATKRRRVVRWFGIAFAFLIDLLGSITFFSIIAWLSWVLYNRLHGHV